MSFWSKMERRAEVEVCDPPGLKLDAEDAERFGKHRWYVGQLGYVMAYLDGETKLLHRLIMGDPKGKHVHHRNGNRLDNRKANLQVLTAFQHMRHHAKVRRAIRERKWCQNLLWEKISEARLASVVAANQWLVNEHGNECNP